MKKDLEITYGNAPQPSRPMLGDKIREAIHLLSESKDPTMYAEIPNNGNPNRGRYIREIARREGYKITRLAVDDKTRFWVYSKRISKIKDK